MGRRSGSFFEYSSVYTRVIVRAHLFLSKESDWRWGTKGSNTLGIPLWSDFVKGSGAKSWHVAILVAIEWTLLKNEQELSGPSATALDWTALQ